MSKNQLPPCRDEEGAPIYYTPDEWPADLNPDAYLWVKIIDAGWSAVAYKQYLWRADLKQAYPAVVMDPRLPKPDADWSPE